MLGAAEAVRQSGKAGQVKIIGWDTSEGQIQSLRDGVITGLIAQNPFKMGYAAVNTAVAKIRGTGEQSANTDTGAGPHTNTDAAPGTCAHTDSDADAAAAARAEPSGGANTRPIDHARGAPPIALG